MQDQNIPHNIMAEEAVIGSMLINNMCIPLVADKVNANDFYNADNKKIYEKIIEMFSRNEKVDILTITDAFANDSDINLGSKVATLIAKMPNSNSAPHYANIVKRKAIGRNLIKAGQVIKELGASDGDDADKIISDAQRELITVAQTAHKNEQTDINSIMDEYGELQRIYEEKKRSGVKLLGISTGIDKLDDVIDGIRPAHFWVIGGYTSTGKTAFSLNILKSLMDQDKNVIYFSLEMSKTDIVGRYLGLATETSSLKIIKNAIGDKYDIDRIAEEQRNMRNKKLQIFTLANELENIIIQMKACHMQNPVDVFFIDFMQLITVSDAKNEYQELSQVSKRLQEVAKEMNVPVIVLSQVNNEHAKFGKKSQVMGFKGSGAIAAAADFAIELARADKQEQVEAMHVAKMPINIDLYIKKNRHGSIGKIQMNFDGETGIFKQGKVETI